MPETVFFNSDDSPQQRAAKVSAVRRREAADERRRRKARAHLMPVRGLDMEIAMLQRDDAFYRRRGREVVVKIESAP